MGYAKRVDANQSDIVQALRGAGCQVIDLHALGREGVPDLLVTLPSAMTATPGGSVWKGAHVLVEVKTETGELRPGQQDFHALCLGPIITVRSGFDALVKLGFNAQAIARSSAHVAQLRGRRRRA